MNAYAPISVDAASGREAWQQIDNELDQVLQLANVLALFVEREVERGPASRGIHAMIHAIETAAQGAKRETETVWLALGGEPNDVGR